MSCSLAPFTTSGFGSIQACLVGYAHSAYAAAFFVFRCTCRSIHS
ncbi:hypothetical protein ABIB66_006053 [Bradyrhizobium sp. F1.13.3]